MDKEKGIWVRGTERLMADAEKGCADWTPEVGDIVRADSATCNMRDTGPITEIQSPADRAPWYMVGEDWYYRSEMELVKKNSGAHLSGAPPFAAAQRGEDGKP